MTDFDNIKDSARERWQQRQEKANPDSRVWTGFFILIIGILALLKSFAFPLPAWLLSWQMLLIGIGLLVGARHGFRKGGWFVPIIVGTAFLVNDYLLEMDMRKHLWPAVLILVGIIFIFKPKRKRCRDSWTEKKSPASSGLPELVIPENNATATEDDFIESTAVFGGNKKNILTKNFKGGDIVSIFGGSELNLTQADIQGKAILDVTAVFGGTSLVIPANWIVRSEVVTIFGGIQDKRPIPAVHTENAEKILVLKGTVLFGGIDIKSY